jgi:lipopolysaccharide export LptBFGC system permease protein LptF
MKIIDRYTSFNLLITGLFAIAVLSVVLVLGNIFKQLLDLLVNHDAPLDLILTFIGYIIPFSLTFTIPWGFLTAVLLVFGKMSAENELVALRANGVSIPRVCLVVWVIAAACVAVCLWINLDVAPRAQVKMKDAAYNIATNNPLSMFESDKIINDFPGNRIYVERHDGDKLYNLLVYVLRDEHDALPMRVIYAKNGWLETDRPHQQLLLHIYNGRYEQRDDQHPEDLSKMQQGITMAESTLPISLKELYEKNKKHQGPSTLAVDELRQRLASEDPNKSEQERAAYRLEARFEISKRLSFSLASFAFGLMGVPLAITAQRRETSIGFLLSLLVAFTYFLFIIIADIFRHNPRAHPEILVWSPNIVFVAIGAVLFYRLSRR